MDNRPEFIDRKRTAKTECNTAPNYEKSLKTHMVLLIIRAGKCSLARDITGFSLAQEITYGAQWEEKAKRMDKMMRFPRGARKNGIDEQIVSGNL
jgi:hypothetical protein